MEWISHNFIEIFGAVTGIIYVFLEIRQTSWLWPVGIATSAVYVWIFFHGRLYADMSLQIYYLVISVIGWFWWINGTGVRKSDDKHLVVTRLKSRTGIILFLAFVLLYCVLYFTLSRFTDSPVPAVDSFITSMSVIATWMLARKIYEHWYLWILTDIVASVLFLSRGLYPTVVLYAVYAIMSLSGLAEWKKTIHASVNIR